MHTHPISYVLTWIVLLVLTAASYLLSHLDLGVWSEVAALGIATTKATLVALFFMHLAHAKLTYRLTMVVAVALVVTMVGLSAGDVAWRDVAPSLLPAADAPR